MLIMGSFRVWAVFCVCTLICEVTTDNHRPSYHRRIQRDSSQPTGKSDSDEDSDTDEIPENLPETGNPDTTAKPDITSTSPELITTLYTVSTIETVTTHDAQQTESYTKEAMELQGTDSTLSTGVFIGIAMGALVVFIVIVILIVIISRKYGAQDASASEAGHVSRSVNNKNYEFQNGSTRSTGGEMYGHYEVIPPHLVKQHKLNSQPSPPAIPANHNGLLRGISETDSNTYAKIDDRHTEEDLVMAENVAYARDDSVDTHATPNDVTVGHLIQENVAYEREVCGPAEESSTNMVDNIAYAKSDDVTVDDSLVIAENVAYAREPGELPNPDEGTDLVENVAYAKNEIQRTVLVDNIAYAKSSDAENVMVENVAYSHKNH